MGNSLIQTEICYWQMEYEDQSDTKSRVIIFDSVQIEKDRKRSKKSWTKQRKKK